MCVRVWPQVLVYGDCAVNVEPSAEELALIAVTSAETAAAFGVTPRVAMLSYSTGVSGAGPQVWPACHFIKYSYVFWSVVKRKRETCSGISTAAVTRAEVARAHRVTPWGSLLCSSAWVSAFGMPEYGMPSTSACQGIMCKRVHDT